jgi:hypothetical protein
LGVGVFGVIDSISSPLSSKFFVADILLSTFPGDFVSVGVAGDRTSEYK